MNAFKFLLVASALAVLAPARPAKAGTLDGIEVVVNGSVITYLQVEDAISDELRLYRARYSDDRTYLEKANELQTNEVEALIQRKLILDDFDKAGYQTNILESAVNDAMDDDIKENYGGSRPTLIKTLQAEGLTFEDYHKSQREQFIIRYMSYHNTDIRKVIISPLKIENFYNEHQADFKAGDEVKLRRIVIPEPVGSPPGTAKEIATEVLQKINDGASFAEMATIYSAAHDGPGGEVGWVSRDEYVAALSEVAFSLKSGQHSSVLELPDNRGDTTCYLLMVEDSRKARVRPLSEVAPEIEQTLKDQESKRLIDQWIKRLEAKSHIETF